MKKLLLTTAAIASFTNASLANPLYLRSDIGLNRFNDIKFKTPSGNIKMNSNYAAPSVELGIGYNILDQLRAEASIGHYFSINKKTKRATLPGGNVISGNVSTDLNTFMIKGFCDVIDLGASQIFIGGGVGVARIKSTYHINSNIHPVETIKEKTANNFTWSLALGSSFTASETVKIDVQYNYQNFGKTSGKISGKTPGEDSMEKTPYRSHAIKVGARFAL